jgi:tetratricopeptide (TPR) repeat protein
MMKTQIAQIQGEQISQDARQLLGLARDWMKQGNTTVAFQLLNEALRHRESQDDRLVKGEISKEIGRAYMQTGEWDRAEDAYERATSIFLEQGHYHGAAESTRNLANLKFQLGQFNDSDSLCERAVTWATDSGDFQLRATILNTQGAIKSIEGKQRESIKIFRLCLSDFRRAGNRLRQAYILHNIGLAHLEIGEYEEARSALEEALILALESQDANLVALCYLNRAKLDLKQGDIVAARSLIKSTGELIRTLKSPNLVADLAVIEANALRLSGDLTKANTVLENALEIAQQNNLLQHEAEILYEFGLLAIEQGHPEIARARLEASITILKKTGGSQLENAVQKLKILEASAKKAVRA